MRLSAAVLSVVMAWGLCSASVYAEEATSLVTLEVPGITCAACEAKIKNAVSAIPGVQSIAASAPAKVAVIAFDPNKVSVDQCIEAIQGAGYLAVVAKSNYRCPHCKATYPNQGECILCEATLESVG